MHYLPNGGTDNYGRPLPAGSYIRVVNGKEYIVLPGDQRIPARIEAEYQAQQTAPQNNPSTAGANAQSNSQQAQAPDEDEDWEGAFSGPDTEDEEIEYPARLLDDIASDIFVSGFLWDNGLTPRYKVGADGDKVVEIKLKNGETVILKGETILELKRDADYFYDKSGSLLYYFKLTSRLRFLKIFAINFKFPE